MPVQKRWPEPKVGLSPDLAAAAVAAAADGIVILDAGGKITGANPAAVALLGGDGAVIGAAFDEFVRGNENLEFSAAPIDTGTELGQVIVLRDSSVRRAASEHTAVARKMASLGEMAGDIAHEFNNHLTGASGFAQMALMRIDDIERVKMCLEEIIAATNAGAEQTGRIMLFGQQHEVDTRPSAIGRHVTDAAGLIEPILGDGISLVLDVADTDSEAALQPGPLTEVLLNLAENANRAMSDNQHGILTIALSRVELAAVDVAAFPGASVGSYVRLTVSDTGCGMTAEIRERMFDPFFSTADVGEGEGLGLPLVYSVVSKAGGMIDVETMPGEGTTVTIYLPVAG